MIVVKLLIATHGRHDVWEACAAQLHEHIKLFGKLGVLVVPYVAVDDAFNSRVCVDHGWKEFHVMNEVGLGKRMNLLNEFAQHHGIEANYYMQLGSDDVLTTQAVYALAGWFHSGAEAFGFKSIYALNKLTGEVQTWAYKMVIGAGRCYRADIWEAVDEVWRPTQQRGLDGNSQNNIYQATGVQPRFITTYGPPIWDVKDEHSLTKWDTVKGQRVDVKVPECLQKLIGQ